MSGGPKLRIAALGKVFATRRGPVTALDGADLEIAENEFVTLVGTSGCGKSTLLSIVAGLTEPSSGVVEVDGRPVQGPGRDRGVVFQQYTLFPWLSARKNVEFALRGEELSRTEQRTRADELLTLVGLDEFADAQPRELSGGMQQRVAIARALSYRPGLLLMDEPFGALDALTRGVMQELLTDIWERHRLTVLFVTHDVEEAVFISDRVLVMTNRPGRIKDEIRVPLPRPRNHEMLSAPEFLESRWRVLESIRSESLAAAKGP
jgi:NitT/TauT family transport system ATP-binding protein